MIGQTEAAAGFGRLAERFVARADPALGEAKGFGARALKRSGKIFAMLHNDSLVVKLTASRVAALVETGDGQPFTASGGRTMREWVAISLKDESQWPAIAEEAWHCAGAQSGGAKK